MALLLATGRYTIRRRLQALDDQGTPVVGEAVDEVEVDGRIRTNAQGADFGLAPEAWPTVEAPADDATVEIEGPDTDGVTRRWVVRHSENRPGANDILAKMGYVQAYGERVDTYEQTQRIQ